MKLKDYDARNPGLGMEYAMNGVVQIDPTCFDDEWDLQFEDIARVDTLEAMYLQIGDVLLVRSRALPEIGDHYILVAGKPVQKEHGVRPRTITFPALQNSPLLDLFDTPNEKAILLKLNEKAKQAFYRFNGIKMEDKQLILPNNFIVS